MRHVYRRYHKKNKKRKNRRVNKKQYEGEEAYILDVSACAERLRGLMLVGHGVFSFADAWLFSSQQPV